MGVIATSANKKRKLLSVLCSSSSDDVRSAGPHGTAAVGLSLKTLCTFALGRYLHPEARCAERELVVKMVTVSHVTAAVSCCLEMALWSTL